MTVYLLLMLSCYEVVSNEPSLSHIHPMQWVIKLCPKSSHQP